VKEVDLVADEQHRRVVTAQAVRVKYPDSWARYYDQNFQRFFQIYSDKNAFFLKNNVIINFLHKQAIHILSQTCQCGTGVDFTTFKFRPEFSAQIL
jgi:hypothetical protein